MPDWPRSGVRVPAGDARGGCAQCGVRIAIGDERWVISHYDQRGGVSWWLAGDQRQFCSWGCLALYVGRR